MLFPLIVLTINSLLEVGESSPVADFVVLMDFHSLDINAYAFVTCDLPVYTNVFRSKLDTTTYK